MIRFQKDFEQVMRDTQYDVEREVKRAFNSPAPQYYGQEVPININDVIIQAITKGVMQGLRTLVQNQYTDEDFERDMGLTK